jgi:hypothetical protein
MMMPWTDHVRGFDERRAKKDIAANFEQLGII